MTARISITIYYCADGVISVYKVRETETSEIRKADASGMVYDNSIVYFKDEKGLYFVPVLEKKPVQKVFSDSSLSHYIIVGDEIFYIQKLTMDNIISMAKYMADENYECLHFTKLNWNNYI